MHRSLVSTEMIMGDQISFDREAARHLQTVLRLREGDLVMLFDGKGHTRPARISASSRHALTLTPAEEISTTPPPRCAISLFACISKGKRMDWTIEKAVELGVSQIIPVLSENTVVKIAPSERMEKAERWLRVAEDAARQCGSAWLPEILPPEPFADALKRVSSSFPTFVAALTTQTQPFQSAVTQYPTVPTRAGYFVGPEGDFTDEEMTSLLRAGAIPVSLGPLVLRAETACLYGLSILNAVFLSQE